MRPMSRRSCSPRRVRAMSLAARGARTGTPPRGLTYAANTRASNAAGRLDHLDDAVAGGASSAWCRSPSAAVTAAVRSPSSSAACASSMSAAARCRAAAIPASEGVTWPEPEPSRCRRVRNATHPPGCAAPRPRRRRAASGVLLLGGCRRGAAGLRAARTACDIVPGNVGRSSVCFACGEHLLGYFCAGIGEVSVTRRSREILTCAVSMSAPNRVRPSVRILALEPLEANLLRGTGGVVWPQLLGARGAPAGEHPATPPRDWKGHLLLVIFIPPSPLFAAASGAALRQSRGGVRRARCCDLSLALAQHPADQG